MDEQKGGLPADELYRRRVAMMALEVMAEAFSIPLSRLTMGSRQRANVAFARQVAMYLTHVVGKVSIREVSIEFGRKLSTVSHACHVIEDRREAQLFDRQISFLEAALEERMEAAAALPPRPREDWETKSACAGRRLARG